VEIPTETRHNTHVRVFAATGKMGVLTGLLLLLLIPSRMTAQSNLDGTWKLDVSTLPTPKGPFIWVLQNGVYECKSCTPPIRVKADGHDQLTSGQSYDTISVTVVDDRTVREIEKKNGHIVSDEKFTVSSDGSTATDEVAYWKTTMSRVAPAPPGSHALSGSWRFLKLENLSGRWLLITYKIEGNTIVMSRPTGQSYRASFDGTDAPYDGDPSITAVSVKRIDANTIEETHKFDGKVFSVLRTSVSADGKSLTISVREVDAGTSTELTASKQ
jgi:hypothetical protein